ncbi:hypothetical protein D3C81_1646150 [compost metagenome]
MVPEALGLAEVLLPRSLYWSAPLGIKHVAAHSHAKSTPPNPPLAFGKGRGRFCVVGQSAAKAASAPSLSHQRRGGLGRGLLAKCLKFWGSREFCCRNLLTAPRRRASGA